MTMKGKIAWNKGKKFPHTAKWEENRIAKVREVARNTVHPKGYTRPQKYTKPMLDAAARWAAENPEKSRAISIKNLPKDVSGAKNGNWRGGLTEKVRGIRATGVYKKWRASVLERCNNRCVDCGSTESLHVHHIIPVSDDSRLATIRANGVVLCKKCHSGTESYAGRQRQELSLGDPVVRIVVIPHRWQDYPTAGNWIAYDGAHLAILVSDTGNWLYNMAVAVHELVEALICIHRGITQSEVDTFDQKFEDARKPGDLSEPGDEPTAPYHLPHAFATSVERMLIAVFGQSWRKYEDAVNDL